jgi:hypothetical protein
MTITKTLFIIAAIAYLAWTVRTFQLGLASVSWTQASGRLIKCYIEESRSVWHLPWGDAGDDEVDSHVARVVYTYRVAGVEYRSTRLSYQPSRGIRFAEAIARLEGLRAGQDVPVYYDPLRPSRSVIIPGASDANGLRIVFAVLLLGVAIWLSALWLA